MKTTEKTTDQKVKELFDLVNAKKLAIQNAEKPCWNTNGTFGYSSNSLHDRVDIKTLTDIRKLVEMYAFLVDRKEKTENASQELGVAYTFSWLGFSIDEWKSDFQTRITQIQIKEKHKELAEIESRLNSIISPELKAQMELEAIADLLKK